MIDDLQPQARTWGRAIGGVIDSQGIKARVREVIRSSQVLTFAMELRDAADLPNILRLDEALALRLEVEAVRVARNLGRVNVEVGLPERWRHPLPLAALRPGQGLAVGLGKSVANRQLALDLASDITPHALIAGATGSGKSVLLQTLVATLARQNTPADLRLLLIDGKAESLRPFASLPHLIHPICYDPRDAALLLAWAVTELERRKLDGWTWRLVIVIDEIAEVLQATGGAAGAAALELRRLAALGRSLGIHVVLATQHPTGDVIGGALAKANLPARLVGRVMDASASTLATGQAGLAAHRLTGRGDFLLVADRAERLQVAMPGPDDLAALPQAGHVARLELDDLAAPVTGPMNNLPDPPTPAQVAEILSMSIGGVPGETKIKKTLGVGSAKARRLQAFCNDLLTELATRGCEVLCQCEESEEEADG